MADKTITSANSIFTLVIPPIYISPAPLQGYSADRAFEIESREPIETVMGVDGIFSAGWVPTPTMMTVEIMPDSPSVLIFEDWNAYQETQREVSWASGYITLPSIQRSYVLSRGVLSGFISIPSAQKVLKSRAFKITWGVVAAVPI